MVFSSAGGSLGIVKVHSTTLKPTYLPEITPDFFSEDLMLLSVVLVGALFIRLVPLTKLDGSFTELSTDSGFFHKIA